MSKVSFRDIVTMRTADPLFKDGVLDKLLPAPPPGPPRHDDALARADDLFSLNPFMQQQMQHQGRSIDQISNSVNHLQDTMADLKHSFTSLRIELHGPNRSLSDQGSMAGPGFDMIATVLKELKSKSDEIEKLKLEIEALKLKNRFMEERKPSSPEYSSQSNGRMADVQSPGLLQAGRKRTWPDAFPTGRAPAIADSFDEADMVEDLSLDNLPTYNVHVPPQQPARQLPPGPAQLRIEAGRQNDNNSASTPSEGQPEQSVAKRQRLMQQADSTGWKTSKKRGRPRKSDATDPEPEATNAENPQNYPVQLPMAASQNTRSRRTRRSTRSQPFGPLTMGAPDEAAGSDTSEQDPSLTNDANDNGEARQNGDPSSVLANASSMNDTKTVEDARATEEEKRKAKIAARDAMTRRTMEKEEQMEPVGSR